MTIDEEIFARMGELSPAEKKVARVLLASGPAPGWRAPRPWPRPPARAPHRCCAS